MSALRVIVADDELLARKRVSRLVAAIPDVVLVAACDSAESLLTTLETHAADVILLDVRMPGLSGLDVAALLPAPAPKIIFVTAHQDHAVGAFDVGAEDYVLKPVDPVRLRRAIDRARAHGPHIGRLAVATQSGILLVDPESITHASFDGSLVTLYRRGEADVITDLSLSELEARLPGGFERVHRRHLVALAHVDRLHPTASGAFVAVTATQHEIPVSRAAARRLRKQLGI